MDSLRRYCTRINLAALAVIAIAFFAVPKSARPVLGLSFFSVIGLGTFAANTHLNEGAFKLNEQLVSLLDTTGASTTYICKAGSIKTEVKGVDSTGQFNQHRGSDFALGPRKGAMTLQFVNPTDNPPTPLQFFSVVDSTGSAVKCILKDVGDKWGVATESMIDVDIQAAANPSAITASLPSLTAV